MPYVVRTSDDRWFERDGELDAEGFRWNLLTDKVSEARRFATVQEAAAIVARLKHAGAVMEFASHTPNLSIAAAS